jgi:hypothetical protein
MSMDSGTPLPVSDFSALIACPFWTVSGAVLWRSLILTLLPIMSDILREMTILFAVTAPFIGALPAKLMIKQQQGHYESADTI